MGGIYACVSATRKVAKIMDFLLLQTLPLPDFQGVLDAFDGIINSSLFSNYIFWFLGIGLVGFVLSVLIKAFKG